MQPLPSDISKQDLLQWVHDCWVMVQPEGKGDPELCHVHEGPNGRIHYVGQTKEHRNVDPRQVFVHWPVCGYVNLPGAKLACEITRKAKKQWTRTYNSRLVEFSIPRQTYLCEQGDVADQIGANTYHVVSELFFPTYYRSWYQVQGMFADNWRSVAMTRRTLITNESPYPLVYYKGVRVGSIEGGVLFINTKEIPHKLFKLFEGLHIDHREE